MEARSRRLGLQHGNSVGRAVFLSKGQACRDSWRSAERRFARPEMPATACDPSYYNKTSEVTEYPIVSFLALGYLMTASLCYLLRSLISMQHHSVTDGRRRQ